MNVTDPASLQNLNDIVLPDSVGWWPLATGWYVLAGFLMLAGVIVLYRSAMRWRRDRYRRIATRELRLLSAGIQNPAKHDASLKQIPYLLKRVALSAYPRAEVAGLSGKDWYRFLNSSISKPAFPEPVCNTLERIAYGGGNLDELKGEPSKALMDACVYWVKHHLPAYKLNNAGGS